MSGYIRRCLTGSSHSGSTVMTSRAPNGHCFKGYWSHRAEAWDSWMATLKPGRPLIVTSLRQPFERCVSRLYHAYIDQEKPPSIQDREGHLGAPGFRESECKRGENITIRMQLIQLRIELPRDVFFVLVLSVSSLQVSDSTFCELRLGNRSNMGSQKLWQML